MLLKLELLMREEFGQYGKYGNVTLHKIGPIYLVTRYYDYDESAEYFYDNLLGAEEKYLAFIESQRKGNIRG
jgi:hypothetical protein